MNVTEVRVTPHEAKNLKAFASITLDDAFVVDGLRVVEGKNGLFVTMPSKKTGNGKFRDTAYPIKNEVRTAIVDAVLEAYNNAEK